MKNPRKTIANNITNRLERTGLQQVDICERTGYSKQRISSYLRGAKRPSTDALIEMSKALNCIPSDLDPTFNAIPEELQHLLIKWPRLPKAVKRDILKKFK